MKLSTLAMTLTVMGSAGAFAADALPAAQPLPLREMVSYMESHYRGEVVAIEMDASGDKAAHYHVDMRYPDAGTAKIDVHATTLAISGRDQPRSQDGWTSLAGAAALASTQLRGQVIAAELDSIDGSSPHYDIDVRLSGGEIARLKIAPQTRQFAWRTPPIMAE